MKQKVRILGAAAAALPAIAALVPACAVGMLFQKNLRRRRPEETFGAKTDVTVYRNSPFPQAVEEGHAYMDTLKREDFYTRSEDGLLLHAAFFPAKENSRNFVIGVHGFQSRDWYELAPHIRYYHELGWNILLPDDRAHGESEGTYVTMGIKDRRDVISWADYVRVHYGSDTHVLLHGVSMGASAVLSASGEADLPPNVFGAIADCGFTSAEDAFRHQIQTMYHLPPAVPVKICGWVAKHKMGFDLSEARPIDQVKHARVPILFVQGGKDIMVPRQMTEALYEACTSEKKLFVVEDGNHAESIAKDPEGYRAAIEEMFHLKEIV